MPSVSAANSIRYPRSPSKYGLNCRRVKYQDPSFDNGRREAMQKMSTKLHRVPHYKPWSAANVLALQNPDDRIQPAKTIRFEEGLFGRGNSCAQSRHCGNHSRLRLLHVAQPLSDGQQYDMIEPHGKDAGEILNGGNRLSQAQRPDSRQHDGSVNV